MAQREILLNNLHAQYTSAFNRPVPNKCKNDVRWLRSKIEERENEKGDKLATKVANTIEKRMLEVTSPPTATSIDPTTPTQNNTMNYSCKILLVSNDGNRIIKK